MGRKHGSGIRFLGGGGIASPRPEAMARPFLRALRSKKGIDMKIAIIGAMESEVELLRERLQYVRVESYGSRDYYEGMLEGAPVVLVACGIGKVSAAVCAQTLIDRFGPTHLIFTGIAGSLDARIDIGDMVVSTDCVQHDFNVGEFGYPKGQIPGYDTLGFKADAELRKLAVEATRAVSSDISVFEGRVASGDQFVSSSAQKEFIATTFGALCCEMEGAAVAQVAYLNELPFVVLRAISDKADGLAGIDYPNFEVIASHQGADVVGEMCRRLAARLA